MVENRIKIYRPISNIKITVKFTDNRLSICGESSDCCGQILDYLKEVSNRVLNAGWTQKDVQFLLDVWERWHLNDLRAGTPAQESFIREWEKTNNYDYQSACKALQEAGLLNDNGYHYGSSWLYEEVPQEILEELFSLPKKQVLTWEQLIEPLVEKGA